MSKISNMSKKKKIILISVLSFVTAILIAAAVIVGLLFRPANLPFREDLGFETVCYELPDDRDPTAHTGIENIAYMNWRLQHQNYWYSEAHVLVDNSTDDQNVSTYKQYYEGVLISTDISKSNLVNKAVQYCQVRGGDVVLFRNSKGGRSTFNAINTPWSTDKPDGHTISEYKVKKGLPPLEFSVYILNENTVKDCSDVIDNGDGTYTQTFVLNYASEPAENDATYWYKTEMAYKAGGMMKEDPQFSEVSITYTFDSTWQVLSSKTKEVYKTITGIGAISCTAEGTTEYTYGDEELSYNSEYENYYKNYLKDYETPEDEVIDAAYCLAEAFSGFLTEDTCLSLDLDVDGEEYSGIVQLNIPENDVRVELGGIKVYMTTEGDGQYLYVAFGDGFKAKIALSDASEPAVLSEDVGGENGNGEVGILDKLLAALGDEENFTIADDKRSATLTPSVNLGELLGIDLDVTLNLTFKFNISEDKLVTVDYVKAGGNILGADFNAELGFTDKGVQALTQAEKSEYVEMDVDGISSVFSAEALKIELSFSGYGLEIEGEVIVNLKDTQVKADLTLTFIDDDEITSKRLSLIYADDSIYLTLSTNGTRTATFKVNIDEAAGIIAELLGNGGDEDKIDILQIVMKLLQKIGTGKVLNLLLADDGLSAMISLDSTGTVITIDGTALLAKFGVEFELGDITASISNDITLSAFGFEATLTGADEFTYDKADYIDASDFMPVLRKLIGAISDKKLSVKGALIIDIDGTQVVLDLKLLSVDWSDGFTLEVSAVVTAGDMVEPLLISYGNGVARASIGSIGIEFGESDFGELIDVVLGMFMQSGDGEGEPGGATRSVVDGMFDLLLDMLGNADVEDIISIINTLEISTSENSLITVKYGGFEISLIDETQADDGILGISAVYADEDFSLTLSNAHISKYEAPEAPDYDIEYFDAEYIMSTVQKIAGYIKENGLSLTGSVTAGDLTVTIEVGVNWEKGAAEVQVKITVVYDTFKNSIYFEYGQNKTALYYDNIEIALDKEDYDSFMQSIGALIDAITADGKKDETQETPDVAEIIALISEVVDGETEGEDGGEGEGFDIFAILGKLGIIKNENGNLEIAVDDYRAEFILNNGSMGISVYKGTEVKPAAGVSLGIGTYTAIEMPTGCQKVDVAEIIPLIDNVTEIIINKGLTVSGSMSLEVGTTTVKFTLYGLSVGWENGLELQLDARLEVNESVHDFYAKYVASTGVLQVVYGALDGGAGIDINIKEDAEGLENALWSIYDRIVEIVYKSVDGEISLPEISVDDLLEWIKIGINAVQGFAEFDKTVDGEDGEEGNLIADILNSLELNFKNGKFSAKVAGVTLMLFSSEGGFNLSVQTDGMSLELKDISIVATEATDFGMEVAALDAQDIADILDYIAATVELFVKDTFKIDLTGTVTTTDDAYADKDGVKYEIEAGLEYQQGTSGYPVHFVPESKTEEGETVAPDFWIAPDMYFHLFVNMEATLPEVDSVLFDIYIFDGNPTVDSNGKTTSTALTSGDNELDIYMSISRISSNQANVKGVTDKSEPVKIYAPMSELMTVLSAGVALVDVGSIHIDAIPELNGIIAQVGSILDAMLVDRYFGDEKERFSSLGEGIIKSALGGSLSDFINDLINGLAGGGTDDNKELPEEAEPVAINDAVENEEGFGRQRSGAIDKLGVERDGNTTTLTLTVGETTTKLKKEKYTYTVIDGEEEVERMGTRLTNLNVDLSELNDTDTLKDLDIDIAYSGVNRVTSLKDYLSIEGLDSLVKALVNSVTHEVVSDDVISGEQGAESKKYALNEVFYINGKINVSGKLLWIIPITSLDISLDALSVTIDEAGDVSFNIRVSYKKSEANLLLTKIPLINDAGTTDISVKNDMLYMKRVSGGQTIYRAMPASEFTGDILNQIGFMLNLGSMITDQFAGTSSSGLSAPKAKQDYGTQLSTYLKSFKYNSSNNTWAVNINGDGLLGGNSIISLDDIEVEFAAENSSDGLVIKKLSFGTKLNILSGVLSLTIDKSKNSLTLVNPQDVWSDSSQLSTYKDLVANDPSADVLNALEMADDREILEKIDWDRLSAETGGGYIELVIVNGQITSETKLKEVKVNYYVKTGIEDDASEKFVTTITQSNALVNTTTHSIYSLLNYPDMSAYGKEGYSLIWLDPVYIGAYDGENYEYNVCARYVKSDLKVTYYGDVQFGGSVESEFTQGYNGQVYERTVSFLDLAYGRPGSTAAAGHTFLGWFYYENESWIQMTDLRTVKNLGHLDEIVLHSLWAKADVGNLVGKSSSIVVARNYDMSATLKISIVGRDDLVSSLNLSVSADFSFAAYAGEDNSYTASQEGVKGNISNGVVSVNGSGRATSIIGQATATTWSVSVKYTVYNNGVALNRPATVIVDVMNLT